MDVERGVSDIEQQWCFDVRLAETFWKERQAFLEYSLHSGVRTRGAELCTSTTYGAFNISYGGGTIKPAHFSRIFPLLQRPATNDQHKMTIIGKRRSMENHLFSKFTLRLFIN